MKKAKYILLVMFMLFLKACNVELHVHSYSEEYQSSQNYHWKECECGHLSEKVDHHGGEATCTSLAVCEDCGVEYGDFNTHKYELVKYDEENHWNECVCGDKTNVNAHTDSDSDGVCDICGYVVGGAESEPPASSEPPKTSEQPESSGELEEESKGLSGGAIAGIIVGSVAVAGVGGFAIFWFVIKKKSFAELIAIFKKKQV